MFYKLLGMTVWKTAKMCGPGAYVKAVSPLSKKKKRPFYAAREVQVAGAVAVLSGLCWLVWHKLHCCHRADINDPSTGDADISSTSDDD